MGINYLNRLFFLMSFFLLLSVACGDGNDQSRIEVTKATNASEIYLYALIDLSDRILAPGQITRDTNLLFSLVDAFSSKMKSKKFSSVGDTLQFYFAQQKGNTELSPIILAVDPVKRAMSWPSHVEKVKNQVRERYQNAQKEKFDGADIWAFFKSSAAHLRCKPEKRRVLILTDGYHLFSSITTKARPSGSYLDLNVLEQLRVDHAVCPPNLTMIPHDPISGLHVVMAEMVPKNPQQHIYEDLALRAWWKAWFDQMGITSTYHNRDNLLSNASIMQDLLR
jgi:hypothetical protein